MPEEDEIVIVTRSYELDLSAGGTLQQDLFTSPSNTLSIIRRIIFWSEAGGGGNIKFHLGVGGMRMIPFNGEFIAPEYPVDVRGSTVITGDVTLMVKAENTDSTNAHKLYLILEVEEV